MGKRIDLTGQRFGRLVVLGYAGSRNRRVIWNCICDCGKHIGISSDQLRSGRTKSCGCYKRETTADMGKRSRVHGREPLRLYRVWISMRNRCRNPNNYEYNNYGGRGISVCDEWDDYPTFRDWALSHGYRDDLSIDRIDNDGNYEPGNCRWSTAKEQANNRRAPRKKEVTDGKF